jgi:hypothetical protein
VQALALHTCAHDIAPPHVPFAPHVSWEVLLVHCVAFGAHTPVQVPIEHAWLAQADPKFCHEPVGSHSWGCCALQPREPGRHWTHAPPWHSGVPPEQDCPRFCHCPPELQNWGDEPLHRTEPGTHPASPPSTTPESVIVPVSSPPSCPASVPLSGPGWPVSPPLSRGCTGASPSPESFSAIPSSMPRMDPHPADAVEQAR